MIQMLLTTLSRLRLQDDILIVLEESKKEERQESELVDEFVEKPFGESVSVQIIIILTIFRY